jgi:hypothetical protein
MRTAGVAVSSLARCNVKDRWGPQGMVSTPEGLALVLALKTKRHARSPIRVR